MNDVEIDRLWTERFARGWVRNFAPPDFPVIVCLCGSTRFKAEFEKAQADETNAGKIVLSVGRFGHQDGLDMGGDLKKRLDRLHFRKIELADEVLVIDAFAFRCRKCDAFNKITHPNKAYICCSCGAEVNGMEARAYIGESTRNEIEYATKLGKTVRYLSKETK